jgi:hypothetical protein
MFKIIRELSFAERDLKLQNLQKTLRLNQHEEAGNQRTITAQEVLGR